MMGGYNLRAVACTAFFLSEIHVVDKLYFITWTRFFSLSLYFLPKFCQTVFQNLKMNSSKATKTYVITWFLFCCFIPFSYDKKIETQQLHEYSYSSVLRIETNWIINFPCFWCVTFSFRVIIEFFNAPLKFKAMHLQPEN